MGLLFTKANIRMGKSTEKVNFKEPNAHMRGTFMKTKEQALELLNCKNLILRILVSIICLHAL